MKISNKVYDLSKWIVLVFLPALSVLIGSLSNLYGGRDASTMIATINLLTVFLGSLLQFSSQNYNKIRDSSGGDKNDTNGSE